jgi:hypothetical protein
LPAPLESSGAFNPDLRTTHDKVENSKTWTPVAALVLRNRMLVSLMPE